MSGRGFHFKAFLYLPVIVALVLGGCSDNPAGPGEGDTVLKVTSISVGENHTCAAAPDGVTYCWGDNTWRQIGDQSSAESRSRPVVVAGNERFSRVSASNRYTCALDSSGKAYCWGDNTWRQLGRDTGTEGCTFGMPCSNVPRAVDTNLRFESLTAGSNHVCGLTGQGRAYCWGENGQGQLGHESFSHGNPPAAVSGDLVFSSLTAGLGHTCGVTSGGEAWCWGLNSFGQLGSGDSEDVHAAPVRVAGGLSFSTLDAGAFYTCGIAEGKVYCWGENLHGKLGLGSSDGGTNVYEPTAVASEEAFQAVSAGSVHTCAISTGGGAFCWGLNTAGGLGTGSGQASSRPVSVAGNLTFASIMASRSDNFTCGRTTDNDPYCWGSNHSGQLGTGNRTSMLSPTKVMLP
jgi:alpha-tubulin suppressor-like RCC1 family protein